MKNRSWIVKLECTVIKVLVVEDCDEEQASENPFEYSVQETEIDLSDWTVKSITPNE